ncbi:hypothetical protein HD806DRAFT_500259 [Xylariaceae sp. AK1471]|nr:hypothetical protein HD806DRAFT_500259 [Xylariaceae sp. AK1471]
MPQVRPNYSILRFPRLPVNQEARQLFEVIFLNLHARTMEATAAVSVSRNFCGFIDFAGKLVSTTRPIHHSVSDTPPENCVREFIARDIQQHYDEMNFLHDNSPDFRVPSQPTCQVAEELVSLIYGVRAKKSKSKWGSFVQALHDAMKRSEVSALVQRLSSPNYQITDCLVMVYTSFAMPYNTVDLVILNTS